MVRDWCSASGWTKHFTCVRWSRKRESIFFLILFCWIYSTHMLEFWKKDWHKTVSIYCFGLKKTGCVFEQQVFLKSKLLSNKYCIGINNTEFSEYKFKSVLELILHCFRHYTNSKYTLVTFTNIRYLVCSSYILNLMTCSFILCLIKSMAETVRWLNTISIKQ